MRRVLGVLGVLLSAGAGVAFAQTADPRIEFAVTGGLVGPVSFGNVDATLERASGQPLVLFRTENRLAPGLAVEAHIGQWVGRRVMVEASGAWQRADFETRVTDDFEGVADATLTARSSRFTVEGGVLVTMAEGSRWTLFARGAGGWMRELSGGGSLVEDGAVASVGAGMKYWWRQNAAGGPRIGLRVEGRASLRTAGISLGDSAWRVAPVVAGGIAFGF